MNGLDGLFSGQIRTMRANLGQISDNIKTIKCKKLDHNYASLTFASRRKNRPDHGSCLRNTRARLVFPLTTGVILILTILSNICYVIKKKEMKLPESGGKIEVM